jgi:hypothetical protein
VARRYRTRGAYLAAEVRELALVIMGVCAFAGGLWLLAAIASLFNL